MAGSKVHVVFNIFQLVQKKEPESVLRDQIEQMQNILQSWTLKSAFDENYEKDRETFFMYISFFLS